MKPKQIIVIRKDLKLPKGKLAVQVAHASVKAIMDAAWRTTMGPDHFFKELHTMAVYGFPTTSPIIEWLTNGDYAKVCVTVEAEKDLDFIFENAKLAKLPCAMIIDHGRTVFNGIPTKTCVAVGPDYPDKIDRITGHLPLL